MGKSIKKKVNATNGFVFKIKKINSKTSSKKNASPNPIGFLKKITISKIAKITKQTLVNNYENFIEKQKNKKLEEIENAKIKRAERIQLEILKEERAHQQKLIDQEDVRLENQRIKLNIEKQQQKIEEQKVKEPVSYTHLTLPTTPYV